MFSEESLSIQTSEKQLLEFKMANDKNDFKTVVESNPQLFELCKWLTPMQSLHQTKSKEFDEIFQSERNGIKTLQSEFTSMKSSIKKVQKSLKDQNTYAATFEQKYRNIEDENNQLRAICKKCQQELNSFEKLYIEALKEFTKKSRSYESDIQKRNEFITNLVKDKEETNRNMHLMMEEIENQKKENNKKCQVINTLNHKLFEHQQIIEKVKSDALKENSDLKRDYEAKLAQMKQDLINSQSAQKKLLKKLEKEKEEKNKMDAEHTHIMQQLQRDINKPIRGVKPVVEISESTIDDTSEGVEQDDSVPTQIAASIVRPFEKRNGTRNNEEMDDVGEHLNIPKWHDNSIPVYRTDNIYKRKQIFDSSAGEPFDQLKRIKP